MASTLEGFVSGAMGWFAASLPNLVAALVLIVAGFVISGWVSRACRVAIMRSARIDNTLAGSLSAVARYAILVVFVIAALGQLGIQTTSLLAALGAAGLAIGLALQGTLSNIAAGFMLLWLQPFRVGEYIDNGTVSGTVKEVGLFATELHSYDNVFQFVPNSELWNTRIQNFTRLDRRMLDLEFGVAYDDDLEKAKSVLLKLADGEARLQDDPAPQAFVKTLGDSAVTVGLRAWCATSDYWAVRWALTEQGKHDLEAAGLSIPFPQMDVHMPEKADAA